jgi:hypothetical protein
MKNSALIFLFFCLYSLSFLKAQTVYSVDYKSDAKVKVFVASYKSDADLIIFFADYKSDAGWKNASKKHLLY